MTDPNSDALGIWEHLKPAIDKEIEQKTRGMVQRRKMKVTTAPSISTGTIGVTEAFGSEMVIPFATNLISATVGDMVWVEFMYGATNAFVSMFASADEKDWDVAGDLSVVGNAGIGGNLGVSGATSLQNTTINGVLDVTQRRCEANVSQEGWYRVFDYNAANEARVSGDIAFLIDVTVLEWARQSHKITLYGLLGALKFGDEVSVTNTSFVDKIRYVKSGTHGYIDIHYTGSSSRELACFFDVKCVYVDNLNRFSATTPTKVDDSPVSPATVLTEYTFAANATPLRYVLTTIPITVTDYGTTKLTYNADYLDLGDIGIVYLSPPENVLKGLSFSLLLQIENLPFSAISANGFVRSLGTGQDGMDTWQLGGRKIYLRKRGGGNLLGTFAENPKLQVNIIGIK